jgi:hypothetical protein
MIFPLPAKGSARAALLRVAGVAAATRLVLVLSLVAAWLFALSLLFTLFDRPVWFLFVVHGSTSVGTERGATRMPEGRASD